MSKVNKTSMLWISTRAIKIISPSMRSIRCWRRQKITLWYQR